MERLNIPVLLGTAREGRESERPAKYIHRLLQEKGVESALVDPRDYHEKKSFEKEHVQPWSDIMKRADALVIVTPEYNHSYPGPLKEMIDALYEEYARKPVAICGVSSGAFGGARVIEQLKPVMIELHMCPIRESVYFPAVQDLFNEKGNIRDSGFDERCARMFEELFWFARALKAGREGVVKE